MKREPGVCLGGIAPVDGTNDGPVYMLVPIAAKVQRQQQIHKATVSVASVTRDIAACATLWYR